MRLVNDILMFVHIMGLFLGLAPGIGGAVVRRQLVSASPEGAAALRQLLPVFANISGIGMLILWASGLVLIFTRWGGVDNLTTLFWVRAVFVVILTILTIMIHMTIREMHKTGNIALSARLFPFAVAAALAAMAAIFITILSFPPMVQG